VDIRMLKFCENSFNFFYLFHLVEQNP